MKTKKSTQSLGERIRQLRRERDFSREKLGEEIGIHWQTIGLYEKDDSIPSALILKKIADAFGVTTDYLLTGETQNDTVSKVRNKELLKRFQLLDRISPEDIRDLMGVMDVYIQKNAVKEAVTAQQTQLQ